MLITLKLHTGVSGVFHLLTSFWCQTNHKTVMFLKQGNFSEKSSEKAFLSLIRLQAHLMRRTGTSIYNALGSQRGKKRKNIYTVVKWLYVVYDTHNSCKEDIIKCLVSVTPTEPIVLVFLKLSLYQPLQDADLHWVSNRLFVSLPCMCLWPDVSGEETRWLNPGILVDWPYSVLGRSICRILPAVSSMYWMLGLRRLMTGNRR